MAPLGPSVTLTLEHASRLWETFHTGALVAEERESCLNWFEDARSYTRKGFVAFSDEVAHPLPRPYPPLGPQGGAARHSPGWECSSLDRLGRIAPRCGVRGSWLWPEEHTSD